MSHQYCWPKAHLDALLRSAQLRLHYVTLLLEKLVRKYTSWARPPRDLTGIQYNSFKGSPLWTYFNPFKLVVANTTNSHMHNFNEQNLRLLLKEADFGGSAVLQPLVFLMVWSTSSKSSITLKPWRTSDREAICTKLKILTLLPAKYIQLLNYSNKINTAQQACKSWTSCKCAVLKKFCFAVKPRGPFF